MNGDVEFTIVSQPSAIMFDCPYCGEEEVEIPWYRVNVPELWTDKWEPIKCPVCKHEIQLGNWKYDQLTKGAERDD